MYRVYSIRRHKYKTNNIYYSTRPITAEYCTYDPCTNRLSSNVIKR